jgi:2-amino-4-hydroxy-6-hydroxymethyldihydropteridine diphosphokinase
MNATPAMIQAVVSLGTNIEPRAQRLADALAALAALPQTHLVKVSSVRETEPVDVPAAFRDQRFLNQIAVCETALEAHDFLRRLQSIETAHGRVRGPVRNMPRTIDLDLIAFGDLVLDEPDLTLPHPRARQRAFVLEPLAEVLPGFRWPDMI